MFASLVSSTGLHSTVCCSAAGGLQPIKSYVEIHNNLCIAKYQEQLLSQFRQILISQDILVGPLAESVSCIRVGLDDPYLGTH